MKLALAVSISFILTLVSTQEIRVCESNNRCEAFESLNSVLSYLKITNAYHVNITLPAAIALSETLIFEDLSSTLASITLRGESGGSFITCNRRNVGVIFRGVENISIAFLTLSSCGVEHSLERWTKSSYSYSSALYFVDCNQIFLQNVTVRESCGSGITMLDNIGTVYIVDCSFINNNVTKEQNVRLDGGSGLFLLLGHANDSMVVVKGSRFLNNYASSYFSFFSSTANFNNAVRVGSGGGLSVTVMNTSTGNTISIENCIFRMNEAIWGGGLHIRFHGEPQQNNVTVSKALIEENFSYENDGGGLDIGIVLLIKDGFDISGNFIRFKHCNFTRNRSNFYGGGTRIYATRIMNSDPDTYFIIFTKCMWLENYALAGSAVDISPSVDQIHINGVLPRPLFVDCTFSLNRIQSSESYLGSGVNVSFAGVGAILNTGFIIQFRGVTKIIRNSGTGLYLSSGTAEFLDSSLTYFESNIGEKGGAVFVGTFAMLLIHDNSFLKFVKNSASFKGGAIFVFSSDPHESLESRTCFIQYAGKKSLVQQNTGINFQFEGNSASNTRSSDVFVQSVHPCSCNEYGGNEIETFLCLGRVCAKNDFNLSSSPERFQLRDEDRSILSEVVPGNNYYSVPIDAFDAYNESRMLVYNVYQQGGSSNLRPQFTHVSRNRMQFVGGLNQTSIMNLETEKYVLAFSIKSSTSCSPGYVFDSDIEKCICGSENIFGVAFCNLNGAYITHGFWIGLCSDGQVCSSHCPLGFCVYFNDTLSENAHLLPADMSSLELFICGQKRAGILCGNCREIHSVFYHSYTYACNENKNCKYGIPVYIVSELLPLTIMFVIIIIFEIRFTAGYINGFILFAQVLDSISIDANGVIDFPMPLQVLTDIHRFVYRTLNFDFFSLESLSFCFWSGATSLDAMAMKYVTVLYAIVLLVLLIVFMNTWKCKKALSCWKPSTIRGSAINGITAFIVICYSQCARVSFQILSPAYLSGVNYTKQMPVVFRSGEYEMFAPQHLRYAIPALAVLLTMSLIPFLLILYPLVYKVLALCKLSESKLANIITWIIPVPLLDVFQSSFKDNCRYFAGFYFLYRLFALAAYAYSSTLIIFYTVVELQLILILALHATVQPYKERWHNVIDSLIFANLAIINGFTLFNYFKVINSSSKDGKLEDAVTAMISLQAILVYLPLVIVIICLSLFCFKKVRAQRTMDIPSDESLVDSMQLPPLRKEENDVERTTIPDFKRVPLLTNYTYGN